MGLGIAVALRGDEPAEIEKASPYLEWLRDGGGEPLIVAPGCSVCPPAAAGLLLTGGEDVDPALYGQRSVGAERVNRPRDDFELALVAETLRRALPLLGICRGAQVLAVALGGSLVQDIRRVQPGGRAANLHRGERPGRRDTRHDVSLERGSRLARLLGVTRLSVNSHHHQAVWDLPLPARIVARSDDGVAEALEVPTLPFVLGVQWHPERWFDPSSRALRDAFLQSARETATRVH